jgi:hypothetical protein
MRFKDYLSLCEASYAGNIGMMEMFHFFEIATPEQKAHMKELLSAGLQDEAWQFLQDVTNMRLTDVNTPH